MSEVEAVEVDLKEQVAKLTRLVEAFAKEHTEFRSVHVSRRGVQGGRGETGPAGPQGPTGAPGKDADPNKIAEAALKAIEFEVGAAKAALQWAVIEELKASGVIDAEGKAILLPGPRGERGASGEQGPQGERGERGERGIRGEQGPVGSQGERGERGERGLTGPQGEPGVSNVPGPQGERGENGERGEQGPEGPQGIPGVGLDKDTVVKIILNMKNRGSI